MKERIHAKILDNCEKLQEWYDKQLKNQYVPFYASFDVRDAGFKIGNIDGNIFPAGFNNICQVDKESAPELIESYMKNYFPDVKNVLLLAEDHLKNKFYWENVITLRDLIGEAGLSVEVGMLSPEITEAVELESFSGKKIWVDKVLSDSGHLLTRKGQPDLVVSNNDFSNEYESVDFSKTKMTPMRELGWFQRKKHNYFEHYNSVAEQFAQFLDEDPWLFQVTTKHFKEFDVSDDQSRNKLAEEVDKLLLEIKGKYKEHGIEAEPTVFLKNNSGTYGLGVVDADSGDEIRQWNYKSKKKMKAAKGGGGFTEVIIQEGVPTVLKDDGATAEPVLYMLGDQLAGGFLRTHSEKGATESLNSPGAVYKRLCLSDLKVSAEGCPLENVYGWVAKLGFLAISKEAQSLR